MAPTASRRRCGRRLTVAALALTCVGAENFKVAWKFQAGTPMYDRLNSCAVDVERNAVYVVGATWGDYGTKVSKFNELQDYYSEFLAIKLNLNTGKQIWSHQDQSGKQDEFVSAHVHPGSGDLIIAGTTSFKYSCPTGCSYFDDSTTKRSDYCAARISADNGKPVWKWQGGTKAAEDTYAASLNPVNGDFFVAGGAVGEYARQRKPQRDMRAYPFDSDFAFTRLTIGGEARVKWQDGSKRGDRISAAAHTLDGDLYLAGETYGSVADGVNAANGADLVVIKRALNGDELWRRQLASAAHTTVTCADTDSDGNVVVGGYKTTDNKGEQFYAIKLKAGSGDTMWEWTDGTGSSDLIQGLIVNPDGTVVLTGHTGGNYALGKGKGLYDFVVIGLTANGKKDWAWQGGSAQSDRANSIARAGAGAYVVAGESYGAYGARSRGGWDFVAFRIEVSR